MLPTRDPAFHYAPQQHQQRGARGGRKNNKSEDEQEQQQLSSLQRRSIAKLYENLDGMETMSGLAPADSKQQQQQQQQSQTACSSSAASTTSDVEDTSSSQCSSSGSTDLDDSGDEKTNENNTNNKDGVLGMMAGRNIHGGANNINNNNMDHLPVLARGFASSTPLPWSVFQRLRRSSSKGGASPQELTSTQEANVQRALAKIRSGTGSIHDSVPVVSAVVDKLCPDLPPHPASAPGPRDGATFALLAVITGHSDLLRACLELGSNPNDQRFLMDHTRRRAQPGSGGGMGSSFDDDNSNDCSCGSVTSSANAIPQQLCHGYTPFFVACLCEQTECMDVLKEYGASLHVTDRWGRTPLHAAASARSEVVVQWLLAQGAPRSIADRDGFRPGESWWGGCSYPSATTSALATFGTSTDNSGAQQKQQQQQQQQQQSTNSSIWQKLGAPESFKAGNPASNKQPVDTAVVPMPVPPRDSNFPHVLFRPSGEQRVPCPCGSGRMAGACGCVDDMHERWYLDRAGARWLSGDITSAISESQSSVLALAFPQFVGAQQQQQQQQQ